MNNFSTNLLGLLRQQWLLLTCDLVNTPAISLYAFMANVCCFYSVVLGIFKSASFIFRFEWLLELFCMQCVRSRGQQRVTSLELILNPFISLWQLACVLSWCKESAEINDDISLYWCFFEAEERHDFVRHSDPQLSPGNWARAKQSRSDFFLY